MSFIDLSVAVNEQTPVYPGDPRTKIAPAGVLAKDGYQDHYVSLGTHVGTHVDAPAHMLASGKSLDQIPVDQFSGSGVLVKVKGRFELEQVRGAGIEAGDIVLFHTGMSDRYHSPEYYEDYPAVSLEVAEYLISRQVKMVGVDTCSVDREPFPVHRKLLGNDVLIIENLTNLAALEGKRFNVYAFPIKLEIDGAPARVVAELI